MSNVSLRSFFPNIEFDDASHSYRVINPTDTNAMPYISVTQFLHTFTEEFDSKTISERSAKKLKIPAQEIAKIWEIKSKFSSLKGTEFHLYAETFTTSGRRIEYITPIDHQIHEFHRFMQTDGVDLEFIDNELVVYDPEWRIAGTIDAVVRDKSTNDLTILDWKTNEKIRHDNKYRKFKPPFQKYDESEIYRYAVQLGIYRRILERRTGMEFNSCGVVIHFPPEGSHHIIQLPDMSEIDEALRARAALVSSASQTVTP